MTKNAHEQIETLVIGGGQAGLAVGYHLSRAGVRFLIVDANDRTGDSWRNRWDSLKLFTPNRFNSLPGLQIPEKTGDSPPRTKSPITSSRMPATLDFRFATAQE